MREGEDESCEGSQASRFPVPPLALFLAAVAVGAALALTGLGKHAFWDDEAHTALLARNLLKLGTLTAWDGQNLVGYDEGRELNADLRFIYAPAQETLITAAGMALFGETEFGCRILFAVLGILGIAATGWWARLFFGKKFPWWLPALLLALQPAYLLYIRNCRYYAASLLWAVLLWAAWTAAARVSKEAGDSKGEMRAFLPLAGLVLVCALGLFTSQYLFAITVAGVLPLFFLDARFRKKRQYLLLGAVYAVLLGCALQVYLSANPFERQPVYGIDRVTAFLEKAWLVSWWQIRDLGYFEFFALPLLLLLLLPQIRAKAAGQNELARKGWILVVVFFGLLIVTGVFSPQSTHAHERIPFKASMRYSLPLLPLGALLGGACLVVLWRTYRVAAILVAVVLVGTNVLYPGVHRDQLRHRQDGRVLRSTLWDFVRDISGDHESVYDSLMGQMGKVPEGTTVRIFPFYAAYPTMFAFPELLYSDQMVRGFPVREDLLEELPEYVFSDYAPEICLLYGELKDSDRAPGMYALRMHDVLVDMNEWLQAGGYQKTKEFSTVYPVGARPEIPERWFGAPVIKDGTRGTFLVYYRRDVLEEILSKRALEN